MHIDFSQLIDLKLAAPYGLRNSNKSLSICIFVQIDYADRLSRTNYSEKNILKEKRGVYSACDIH